jgi:hypothetical protein
MYEINDAWMFCFTKTRDDLLWLNQSNYSKSIKIHDVFQLFERCAVELEKRNRMRSSWGDCKYENIWGTVDNGKINEPNYYRKSPLFESQQEQRMVFEPFEESTSYNLLPIVVNIKVDDIIELLN